MKTLLYTFMLSMLCVSLSAQKVTIKDANSNVLMEVNDEGKSGSITLLPDLAPLSTKNKLYNISSDLYWDGTKLGTSLEAAGWKLTGSNIYPLNLTYEVGIGTNSPSRPLEVVFPSSVNNLNPIALFRTSGSGNSVGALKVQNAENHFYTFGITQDPANAFAINYNSNISLGSDLLRLTPDGMLGLGTTNPSTRFHMEAGTTSALTLTIHNTDDTGSERLFFGTSTGSDALIWAYGSGASSNAGKFRFLNNRTGANFDWVVNGGVKMTLSNDGYLGLGTTTPSYPFHAVATNLDRTGYFEIETDENFASGVYGSGSGAGPVAGTYGKATGDSINYGIIGLAFNGGKNYGGKFTVNTTTSEHEGYGIHATATGNGTNYAGFFEDGDVVLESGDLGVGMMEPAAKAHILQDLGGVDAFRVDDAVSDPSPFLIKSNGAIGVGTTLPMAKMHIIEESVNDAFRVDDAASDATPFVIKDDGSVGIGTTSPGTKLHVDGYVTIDEKLVAGDDNGLKFCTNEQTTRMLIDDAGAVGIGTLSPAYNLHLVGTSAFQRTLDASPTSGSGLISTNGNTVSASLANRSLTLLPGPVIVYRYYGVRGEAHEPGSYQNIGVYGRASGAANNENWAGFFDGKVKVNGHQVINGDLTINGTISKTSGTFRIDHPLDPENKYLSHSFVESPDMMNVYNGNVTTNADGRAEVILPHYFEALNKDFRYQLTVIGEFAQAIIAKKISGNKFEIRTDKPHIEVSWQVTGIRQDAYANKNRVKVEENKAAVDRGTYLHPEAFGKPVEMREGYERMPNRD